MILRMIGLNTSALQAKNTTTTAEQKFHNGKNQKSGWKGMCVCLFSFYKKQVFLRSFKSSWAYLTDYCNKRSCQVYSVSTLTLTSGTYFTTWGSRVGEGSTIRLGFLVRWVVFCLFVWVGLWGWLFCCLFGFAAFESWTGVLGALTSTDGRKQWLEFVYLICSTKLLEQFNSSHVTSPVESVILLDDVSSYSACVSFLQRAETKRSKQNVC